MRNVTAFSFALVVNLASFACATGDSVGTGSFMDSSTLPDVSAHRDSEFDVYADVGVDALDTRSTDDGLMLDAADAIGRAETSDVGHDAEPELDTDVDARTDADTDPETDTAAADDASLGHDSASTIDSPSIDSGTDGLDRDVDAGEGDSAFDGALSDLGTDTSSSADTYEAAVVDSGSTSLLISELQTRGSGGGNDEFIEIYNAGSVSVTFDSTWTIAARSAVGSCASAAQAVRYMGTGQLISPHKHLLLTNSGGYDGLVTGDDTYATGIPDASSVVLFHGAALIDAVCFSYDAVTASNLASCSSAYFCEGTPASNLPHNNTAAGTSNSDVSLERKPGGVGGNGVDTGDTAADFTPDASANPQNLASLATP